MYLLLVIKQWFIIVFINKKYLNHPRIILGGKVSWTNIVFRLVFLDFKLVKKMDRGMYTQIYTEKKTRAWTLAA